MVERLQQIPAKLLELWSKYTSKQKTVIISVIAVIVLAFALLYVVVTKTQYVTLQAFDTAKNASELTDLLKAEGIKYKLSKNGRIVSVDEKKQTDAIVLMDKNDIIDMGIGWDDVFNNSMSTTESEKSLKASLATTNKMRGTLLSFEGVKDASLDIHTTNASSTIFAEQEEAYVSVKLTLDGEMDESYARTMAKWLATAVGNSTTERVTIIDSQGNMLFDGAESSGLGGNVSSFEDYRERLRNQLSNNLRIVLYGMNYDDVQVGTSNLKYNMDKVSERYTEYSVEEGREEGFYDYQYEYKSEGASSAGGVPGTASNADETDYGIVDESGSNSKVESLKTKYLPNERIKNMEYEMGAFDAANSSLAVVLTKQIVYDQEAVERQDLLQGITWEEFIDANSQPTQVTEIPQDVVDLISKTTGIDAGNIAVAIWEKPIFNSTIEDTKNYTNYIMIALAILILALLIFVVFKGTAPIEVTEMEPELSVEQLLATTKENQSLQDIEYGELSETRKMIEKFVEEKPEAVAQLLRNWLNEDWG